MAQKQSPKGRGLWITLLILLILWNLTALLVGLGFRVAARVRSRIADLSSKTESTPESVAATSYNPWNTTEPFTTAVSETGAALSWLDTTEPSSMSEETAVTSETPAASTVTPATAPPAVQQTNPPAVQQTNPPAVQQTAPPTEAPVITPPTDSPGNPSLNDFTWYGSTPSNVTYMDFYEALGEWKGMIVYDESTKDMVNVLIDIGQSGDILMTIDWYQLTINGEPPVDETSYEDTVFTGYQWGNGILVSGLGDIEIVEFYSDGSRQYATGTLTYNGAVYAVALVR